MQAFLVETEHNYLTTHHKLCFAIIARIYRRVLQGYKFGAIKVSNKRLIVDGNHRYIAYQLAGIEFEILEATHSFCDQPERFNQIKIDTKQDWDANHPDTKKYCNDDFLTEENY
ncbi:hypothetical protein EON73_05140 [bacterium]|nr:MAG: hypothetical protein EON73_05140 [bacterium]